MHAYRYRLSGVTKLVSEPPHYLNIQSRECHHYIPTLIGILYFIDVSIMDTLLEVYEEVLDHFRNDVVWGLVLFFYGQVTCRVTYGRSVTLNHNFNKQFFNDMTNFPCSTKNVIITNFVVYIGL